MGRDSRPRGTVVLPWVNDGKPVVLPELTLQDTLDLMEHEVATLRRLGMTDQLPKWQITKLEDMAAVEFMAEALARRIGMADPRVTREVFDTHVQGAVAIAMVADLVAKADAELGRDRPRFLRAPTQGGGRRTGASPKNASQKPGRAWPP